MKFGLFAGAALLVVGLNSGALAMNLQPGMLTMMQQGGQEHGVQVGCALPGYDPRMTCSPILGPRTHGSYGRVRRFEERVPSYGGY